MADRVTLAVTVDSVPGLNWQVELQRWLTDYAGFFKPVVSPPVRSTR